MRGFSSDLVRLVVSCLVLMLMGASVPAKDAAEVVTLGEVIPFAEDSGATEKVQDECQLETRLPEFIRDFAKGMQIVISGDPIEEVEGKVLILEISHVLGFSGGAWSGPKSMSVKGELRENGEVVGSFLASRFSTGGAFGGYKGTCSILGRCVKAIGKDIANWLKNPKMDSKLGDA